jgi:demethylmenaquinone methyltransferase/2-methoxy-6-polyprenyl-1,4-benzoquinol methylase
VLSCATKIKVFVKNYTIQKAAQIQYLCAMSQFAHDKVVPYSQSNADKKEQVASMFDSIAKRYDFLNRFLSLGIDQGWRKKAISYLKDKKIKHLLDIATGTADMALMAYSQIHPEKITGIDISEGMMQYGRVKIQNKGLNDKIQLSLGDSTAIPFEASTFDGAMVAFGVRNFANLEKGLQEIHRVLTLGSKLVILEFSQPSSFWFKPIYTFYMKWVTPTIGKLFSGNKEAYAYLNESVIAFPEGAAFLSILEQAGFKNVSQEKLSLGICSIYCASK